MALGVPPPNAQAKAPLYTLATSVPLGGISKWHYLYFDPASDRVFISHGRELILVGARTGKIVAHVAGLAGSHGIAIDNATGLCVCKAAFSAAVAHLASIERLVAYPTTRRDQASSTMATYAKPLAIAA